MKRDMDVIRSVLQKVESCEDPCGLEHMPEIDGYSQAQVSYHTKLLHDAGLVEAEKVDQFTAAYPRLYGDKPLHEDRTRFLGCCKRQYSLEKSKGDRYQTWSFNHFDLLLARLKAQVETALGLP